VAVLLLWRFCCGSSAAVAVLLWQFCCYSGGGSAVLGRNPNLGDGCAGGCG